MANAAQTTKKLALYGGLLGLGIVAGSAGTVLADWGRGWRHDGPGGPMGRQARFERFCANDTARYQPVVRAFAKADLRLNDQQSKDFDGLADQVLPALEDVKKEACNNFVSRGGTAPDKLAHLAAVLRKAADAAEKAVGPVKSFYATLTPEQQTRIDELADRRPGGRWR